MADYVQMTKLNRRTILYRHVGQGFSCTVEARENFLSLFRPSDRKKITNAALMAAGNDWIQFRLPDRFSNFARYALGYKAGSRYELRKLRREGKEWNERRFISCFTAMRNGWPLNRSGTSNWTLGPEGYAVPKWHPSVSQPASTG